MELFVELEKILEAMTVCEQFIKYWDRIEVLNPDYDAVRLVRRMHKDFNIRREEIRKDFNDQRRRDKLHLTT